MLGIVGKVLHSQGFVALFGLMPDLSLSQIFSAHADRLGRPE